uniref:Uncharacterized protein n=1 Tax=Parastrongyloides trichosuri TaxID=131310 RepID=A0A0N4ZV31_PARTI
MAFIKEYNFDCQRELYKQGNQIFVLIYKARSFCKDLNDKRIKTLTKERNDIQTKLLDFIVFTNKVKKDLEITNKKEGERIKNIEEIVQNRNIDETIEIIINKKQNFIEIQNDIKKKIKNVKSYKLDFVHDFKMEDLNEFEKEFCNNINKDYEIINLAYCDDKFTEEELISMSYGELRRNIKTLNDEEKIKQCKNEIKRRVEEW